MTELHWLSALEQAALVRRGEVSSVELTEHHLRRTDALDATVGAYVTRADDLALELARAADARVAAAGPDEPLPPLLGTVVPVKDLDALAGVRMRGGSAVVDVVPDTDDEIVALMRRDGLVLAGKTNAPEFGLPCYTEPDVAPPARTPWDLARSAGGSSGGAAAAVAAGLAAAAHGNDGGGSLRIPASVCGLVTIKPSRGRVTHQPWPESVGELTTHGPLARTVADAAALLDTMAADVVGDVLRARPLARGDSFLAAARREPGRLRVGRYAVPVIAETDVDPHVLAVYEDASRLLESLGHDVEDVPPPFAPDQVHAFEAVWSILALGVPVEPADEERLRPLTRWLRERGRGVTGQQLSASVSLMRSLTRAMIRATDRYDAVLTPTLAQLPAAVGGLRDDADPAADFEAQKRFTPFTSPYNVSGQPAVSLPLGWPDVGGVVLPVGIQLVGRPGEEALLVSLAAQLERAAPWAHRRPPL
ncbi:MAG TPA: amidase [Candidatus Nanopelagicales bacterium]|nr:amidase [Candidatus Nanopelagicales bacterium]